jgi:acyl-CoA ligase (AMP-forming) (exosortase A-associated)
MKAHGTCVHQLVFNSAASTPHAEALVYQAQRLDYATLAHKIAMAADMLNQGGAAAGERVAVYLEKRIETVTALFGAAAAGAVMVPVNPLLKAPQVAHILNDCGARVLVTSVERLALLADVIAQCPALKTIFLVGDATAFFASTSSSAALSGAVRFLTWEPVADAAKSHVRNTIGGDNPGIGAHNSLSDDAAIAAILYTSGSTGRPKGVVLTHRNLVTGATSVTQYLGNTASDRILALLPLSFDYGLNQLTTAFLCGATAVLMNYLLPRDVLNLVRRECITGLGAVPPLWHQLAQQPWPADNSLRYVTNSGGAMPRVTLNRLRQLLPQAQVYLMYGLTEAFRSTYLPPAELDRRPGSIGRAIPGAEVLVLRPDGSLCADDEPGELVHRGPLVAKGYWNDADTTAARFRPVHGAVDGDGNGDDDCDDVAVWSGDTVRRDAEGFLYFIGRRDDMIKVSGYRISPQEIEEAVYATGMVEEAVAIGVPHPDSGQAIAVVVSADINFSSQAMLKACQSQLPSYMMPAHVEQWDGALPRTPNGKIDRQLLQQSLGEFFKGSLK